MDECSDAEWVGVLGLGCSAGLPTEKVGVA